MDLKITPHSPNRYCYMLHAQSFKWLTMPLTLITTTFHLMPSSMAHYTNEFLFFRVLRSTYCKIKQNLYETIYELYPKPWINQWFMFSHYHILQIGNHWYIHWDWLLWSPRNEIKVRFIMLYIYNGSVFTYQIIWINIVANTINKWTW